MKYNLVALRIHRRFEGKHFRKGPEYGARKNKVNSPLVRLYQQSLEMDRSQTKNTSVKDYGNRLFAFIRGRVRTDEDAEDILQDVWYQLYNTTEAIDQVGAWLFRVARNKIIDRYRKKKPESLEDQAYEDEDGEIGFKEILLSESGDPETEYLKGLFWEQLYEGLEELPKEQREVFILNELEGKTFAEISEATGENIKTLISRKGYAVKRLRTRLQTLYDEFINY